jgi:flagellar basal-body rod protein FlgF
MQNAQLVALSRHMALQREIDIVANNIANINTTGFKTDGVVFQEMLMPGASADQFARPDRRLSFVQDRATWLDLTPGAIQQTGNPLDLAISGDGFIAVQTSRGERYTRNGALQINARGQLVTSEGDQVLGDNGPITLQAQDQNIAISGDGTVSVRQGAIATIDARRGKIRVVTFAQPQLLQKDGSSTFSAPAGAQPQAAPATVRLVQGALEKSNVRGVVEMTRMIEVTRAYTQLAGMVQSQSDQRKSAIQQLADVPTS